MSLKILAGDFKSGSANLTGFHLEPCNGAENIAEFIPLSQVQALERLNNIREAVSCEEWVSAATLDLEAFTKLITDAKARYVPFIVRFKDDRKMIALAEVEAWNQLTLRDAVTPDERFLENSRSSPTLQNYGSDAEFGRIDWAAAAPGWASIVVGAFLPALAVVALIFLIDVVLCWLFERWIGHFWTIPLWLVATMVFPFALVGAIALARVLMQISSANWITKSKEFI